MFLKKQTGEVVENTGEDYIGSQKQTGKQSGEVVENTCLWKKQTGTNRKTNRAMLLKIHDRLKSSIGYSAGLLPALKG